MRRTEVLQEIRKMRFDEAYRGWHKGQLKVDANLLKSVGMDKNPMSGIMHVEQDPSGYSV